MILYSMKDCPACLVAKGWLEEHNFECDIIDDIDKFPKSILSVPSFSFDEGKTVIPWGESLREELLA